jgi:flagellar assembly factor FliW
MIVESYRFGVLQVAEEDLIQFPGGLVGLSHLKRFVLLCDSQSQDLYWLQSTERPEFALALMHRDKLAGQWEFDGEGVDTAGLALENSADAEVFVILNRVQGTFTVNLKGPILVNARAMLGKQVVLSDARHDVRHPLTALEPAMTA